MTDMSGNGNTGTLVSMSTSSSPVAGKIGQALKFAQASSQYIDLGNVSALKPTGAISVSAWVKPASLPANAVNWGIFNSGTLGTTGFHLGARTDGAGSY